MAKKRVDLVELVTWTYRDCRADRVGEVAMFDAEAAVDGVQRQRRSADGTAQAAQLYEVGALIKGGPAAGRDVPRDAAMVDGYVSRLGEVQTGAPALIRQYGYTGEPPDWRTPPPLLTPANWKRHGVLADYSYISYPEWRGARFRYTPLILYNGPTERAMRRLRYANWHDAMKKLLCLLKARPQALSHHECLGFGLPARPWEAANDFYYVDHGG